ncbi:unnamed protein product [Mytilus coruscus]|uniref:Farnesoic acid O-methyl transferase domain-containing protein n=1 Tax=Mytilus coruscus TaxID=42192 RepID=A0A6J8BYM3_MYTCO|nr:unnamed protein product [Mytilus coruscus]
MVLHTEILMLCLHVFTTRGVHIMNTLSTPNSGNGISSRRTHDIMKYSTDINKYNLDLSVITSLMYEVKACKDAFVLLSNSDVKNSSKPLYEIQFGNNFNRKSRILYRINDSLDAGSRYMQFINSRNILNCNVYLPFWISWAGGKITYGTGLVVAENTLDSWINTNQFAVNGIEVYTSFSETGDWKIHIEDKFAGRFDSCSMVNNKADMVVVDDIQCSSHIECATHCGVFQICMGYNFNIASNRCEILSFGSEVVIDIPHHTEAGWKYLLFNTNIYEIVTFYVTDLSNYCYFTNCVYPWKRDRCSAFRMFPPQVLLITCMMSAILHQYSEGYSSCQEIYQSNNRNPSGEYTVYHSNKSIRVYCSFEESWGYTYISKASYGTAVIMSKLYSTRKFVKTRIRWSSGIQKEVTVENLLSYQNSSTLYFGYNSFTSYKGPRSSNANIMSPYIFLGFLPLSLATNNNTQGYRTAGVDYTFKNCDRNPNSYLTFYYNPNNAYPGKVGSSNTFMMGWIDRSSSLASSRHMSADFYFDWEMHMGGCGGFMTSQSVSNIGAALGLPFAISPCDGVDCQNGGNCVSSESTGTAAADVKI